MQRVAMQTANSGNPGDLSAHIAQLSSINICHLLVRHRCITVIPYTEADTLPA